MTTPNNTEQPKGINRRRVVLILLVLPLFFALFMFLPAGTWAWTKGWLFIAALLVIIAVVLFVLWRVNPEVVVTRSHTHEGTKRWDKILLWFYFPTIWAIVPVAALDDGRFQWSDLSWWVCAVGYALLLVGVGITTWAEAVNKFFEPTVRIQTERGHRSSTPALTPSCATPAMWAGSSRRRGWLFFSAPCGL